MKICENCGAHNSDDRKFCIDCTERLGEQLSEKQEEEVLEKVQNTIKKIENKNNPLYVDLFDKITGFISVIGILILVGFFIMEIFTGTDLKLLFLGILFFAISALDSFVPSIAWSIEKITLSIKYSGTDDITPGMFYKWGRKIGNLIFTAFGIAVIVSGIIDITYNLQKEPVIDLIDTVANYKAVSMSSNPNDYILASPEEWQEIIDGGEKSVNALIDELKEAENTGLRELLMMRAVNEITKLDIPYSSACEFVADYTIMANHPKQQNN